MDEVSGKPVELLASEGGLCFTDLSR